MTRLTIRDKNVAALGTLLVVVVSVATYVLGILSAPKYTFYDGEGNVIPSHAVDSQVTIP